ncbi:MAG: acetate/propionate family kinase [Deltaproteobacteria bacterium]|nr:acetate/propionate family kinase [Deltaproteobacteria bacterium]
MTQGSSSRPSGPGVLAINGGSSSIKFALFETDGEPRRRLYGKIDRIGLGGASLVFNDAASGRQGGLGIEAPDHRSAADFLIGWIEGEAVLDSVKAVGHRVVHGMERTGPERVTPDLLAWLNRIKPYDPDHLPLEIELIEAFCRRCPGLPQLACFDTAFHSAMPRAARLLPIPRRYDAQGVRRYGFHGLSYAYLMEELARLSGVEAVMGRVILAHLGNGASMAAVLDGRGVDTSMGFTPAAGLPMGTRPGDIDPGVAWHLMRTENLTPEQFNRIINHESGLLGVSETSSDMRDLIGLQAGDVRAAEAVELFCYQARKWIGAFAAALGGLDTLVFSGGIGENSAEVRSRICGALGFLGVELDGDRNAANGPVISAGPGRVVVRVIRTDEELMIARAVCRGLGG